MTKELEKETTMDQKPTLTPESAERALAALHIALNVNIGTLRMACGSDKNVDPAKTHDAIKSTRKTLTAIEEIASHLPQEDA